MSFAEYRQARAFPGLDGLRAIAATIVVVFHFGGSSVRLLQGWVGVQVFFALSGFLITTLALREVERAGRLDFRAFYLRRLFRITPVYLVVLLVVLVQCQVTGQGQDRMHAALPYYLTFLNDLAPSAAYTHTWTLGIEQKFYLLWPLLAFGLVRSGRGRIGVTLTAIALLLPLWDLRRVHSVSFVVLLLGALLAIVMHHPRGFALVRPLLTPVASVLVGIGYLAFHLQFTWLLGRFGEARVIPLYGLAICLLLPAVIGPGPVRWLLSRRPMVFVGQRSYSLYLVQFVAGAAVAAVLPVVARRPSAGAALVTWVVAVLFADLLYRWVELPLIRYGRRVAGGRRVPAAVETGRVPAGVETGRVPGPVGQPGGADAVQAEERQPREQVAVGHREQ